MRHESSGNRYFSFQELAEAFDIKPRKKNEQRQQSKQKKFMNRHKCKACGEPMNYIGGNICVCQNKTCHGISKKLKDGTVIYLPSYNLLDDVGAEIASKIF